MSKMYAVEASRRRTASVTPVSAGADRPGGRAAVFLLLSSRREERSCRGRASFREKAGKREEFPVLFFKLSGLARIRFHIARGEM